MTVLDRIAESYERSLHLFGIHGKVDAILVPLFAVALLLATYSTVRLVVHAARTPSQ